MNLLSPEELEARVEAARAQGRAEGLELQEKARLSVEELRGELLASFKCCKKKCAGAVPVDEACKQRSDRMMLAGEEHRREDLLNRITLAGNGIFTIASRPVCQKFFLKVLHASRTSLAKVQKHGNAARRLVARSAPKEQAIVRWLDELSSYGDRMPDSRNVHIPYPTVQAVWDLYAEDHKTDVAADDSGASDTDGEEKSEGSLKVSRSYFLRVWRDQRASIKLQGGSPFALCVTCEELDDLERKQKNNPVRRDAAIRDKKEHIALVKAERQAYYDNRTDACKDKEKFLSLIVDGADQSSFGLPHFYRKTKDTSGIKIPTKLYGVIAHGRGSYAFTVPPNAPTGVNLTVEIVHRVFQHVLEMEGRLPKTLTLQLDNTTGQNKNNYLLAFLALLVGWKVFENVYVNFLPVGHTHEDIDQMFSRFAIYNRVHDATTPTDLLNNCREAFYPRPLPGHIENQANIKEAIDQTPGFVRFENITEVQSFFISRDAGGLPVCMVKHLMSGATWKTSLRVPTATGHYWFGATLPTPEEFFDDIPATVYPAVHHQKVDEMRKSLEKCKARLADQAYKVALLYDILDGCVTDQPIAFTWDVGHYIEASNGVQPSSPDTDEDPELDDPAGGRRAGDVKFPTGHFIVVRHTPTADDPHPFWVARIIATCYEGAKECSIVWFRLNARGKDPYKHAYVEATLPDDRHAAYVDTAAVATIITSFPSLNKGKLPADTAKIIVRVES